jgi:hypothetical protein
MKIVVDEMGGIKVGNIWEKCKKLDSWQLDKRIRRYYNGF